MAIFSFLKNQKSWRVIFRYEARVRWTDLYNVMYFQYMRGCWPISKNLIKYWISFLSFFFFGWAKNFSVPPCSLTQSQDIQNGWTCFKQFMVSPGILILKISFTNFLWLLTICIWHFSCVLLPECGLLSMDFWQSLKHLIPYFYLGITH